MTDISREEFIRQYLTRSGIFDETDELLLRRVAIPAELDGIGRGPFDCDYEGCEGWHMLPRDGLEEEIARGYRPESLRKWL